MTRDYGYNELFWHYTSLDHVEELHEYHDSTFTNQVIPIEREVSEFIVQGFEKAEEEDVVEDSASEELPGREADFCFETFAEGLFVLHSNCVRASKQLMEGEELLSSQFPPGFRFHPTDQELITQYLWKKVTASLPADWAIIADIDLYKYNPWDLPEKALFGQGEWFFFSPRERKYPNGVRPNRAAASGYWKATGTDKPILSAGGVQCIGVKKALVFYKGKPPKGTKTDWVMQEYRLLDSMAPTQTQKQKSSMRLDDWVLCRVRMKGNSVGENDEMLMESPNVKSVQERHMPGKEKSSSNDWGDHLSYLLESPTEGKEASGEGSSQGFVWSSEHLGCVNYAEAQQNQSHQQQHHQQQQHQQQHSNKQLQCSGDGWFSQNELGSSDQGCFTNFFSNQ
ncbi:hypothetical protein KFK09_023042 [Dendrobium nobile]|uniref:NAC domain-containing protein n=1 Tax=Dendrobium nobile TaxID=94219 RepID=A0A8T3AL17_DENNO|nr:hypothetical protein KFK09_023042 [Dendrobium nobile]